ncbi:MAG: TonB-dependent receptor [Elusimicrobia bacterium]|nr:TonB-dependent receptor [Elusimicrobiota bacterium]
MGTADQPSHTHRTYSAFLQDEIKIVPRRWSVTAGSKLEWNDFTGTEIQPRLNTALSLNDDHTVWGAVSRAVRTPPRWKTPAPSAICSSPRSPPRSSG